MANFNDEIRTAEERAKSALVDLCQIQPHLLAALNAPSAGIGKKHVMGILSEMGRSLLFARSNALCMVTDLNDAWEAIQRGIESAEDMPE